MRQVSGSSGGRASSCGEEVALLRNCFAQGRWFEVAAARIVLSARDVTERLQAEALRRQAEERFRILVDGVKDYAISMLDIEGRIASWNVGGERAFDSLRSDGRRGRRDQEEIRANTPCRLSVRGAGRGAGALRALEVPQSPNPSFRSPPSGSVNQGLRHRPDRHLRVGQKHSILAQVSASRTPQVGSGGTRRFLTGRRRAMVWQAA